MREGLSYSDAYNEAIMVISLGFPERVMAPQEVLNCSAHHDFPMAWMVARITARPPPRSCRIPG